jgi:hypothetical protein
MGIQIGRLKFSKKRWQTLTNWGEGKDENALRGYSLTPAPLATGHLKL